MIMLLPLSITFKVIISFYASSKTTEQKISNFSFRFFFFLTFWYIEKINVINSK